MSNYTGKKFITYIQTYNIFNIPYTSYDEYEHKSYVEINDIQNSNVLIIELDPNYTTYLKSKDIISIEDFDYSKEIKEFINYDIILNKWFYGWDNLESIDFLEHLNLERVIGFTEFFSYCTKLKNLSGLKNWDISKIIDTSYMFYKCECIENLDALSKWKPFSLIKTYEMFCNCKNLSCVKGMKEWDKYLGKIYNRLYYMKPTTDLFCGIGDFSYMFYNCESLQDISSIKKYLMLIPQFPSSVLKLNEDMKYIMPSCFYITGTLFPSRHKPIIRRLSKIFSYPINYICNYRIITDLFDNPHPLCKRNSYDDFWDMLRGADCRTFGYHPLDEEWLTQKIGDMYRNKHDLELLGKTKFSLINFYIKDFELREAFVVRGNYIFITFDYQMSLIKGKTKLLDFRPLVKEYALIEGLILANWFLNCNRLKNIDFLKDLDLTNVTCLEYMFTGCKSLDKNLQENKFDVTSYLTLGEVIKDLYERVN